MTIAYKQERASKCRQNILQLIDYVLIMKSKLKVIYNDIISQCERIGDYAINVDEAFKNTV